MVIGRKDVPSTLRLTMISDENENQFYNLDISDYYLIYPDFILLYRKKNFEIFTNFTRTRFLRPTRKINRKIAKFCKLAII